jgi:hypothetical protein
VANRRTQTGQRSGERPTKAQRKEQARRERLEIQRRMARARRNRWIALGVAAVLAAGVALFVVTRPKPKVLTPTQLLAASADQATAAGCSKVRTIPEYGQGLDRAHIGVSGGPPTMPAVSTYPSVPPASGPHNQTPLDAGEYASAPPLDQTIHSLEHGAAIVWYAPDAPSSVVSQIKSFYRTHRTIGSRVIVAPYEYPDQGKQGSLPAGTQMALVAWHRMESCARPNLAAAFGFTARYAAPPYGSQKYLGEAPEAGRQI